MIVSSCKIVDVNIATYLLYAYGLKVSSTKGTWLRLGAQLSFLEAQGFLSAAAPGDAVVLAVNALVSMLPKRSGSDRMVIDLRSVSSLTGSEYLRPFYILLRSVKPMLKPFKSFDIPLKSLSKASELFEV